MALDDPGRRGLGPDRVWPARVAARKGPSFFGYLFFSLVFFPAALIVTYMVSDRSSYATA